jgi:ribosomal protein S18 acetylase RimI-like enzyme
VRWIPWWVARPIRRYVAWTERNVKTESVTLELTELQSWAGGAPLPEGLEILPLPQVGDERFLRFVYNEAARDSPGFRPARLVDMIAFAAAPHHDPRSVFIARLEGEYVGTCVARYRPDGAGMVYSLSVRAEYRRRGLARALLHTALQRLKERGASSARLYAHPENAPAISLYLREGFQLIQLPPPAPISPEEEAARGRPAGRKRPLEESCTSPIALTTA